MNITTNWWGSQECDCDESNLEMIDTEEGGTMFKCNSCGLKFWSMCGIEQCCPYMIWEDEEP